MNLFKLDTIKNKEWIIDVVTYLLAILMFTFLRKWLIVFYPLIIALFFFAFKVRLGKLALVSIVLAIISSTYSIIDEGFYLNTIISILILFIPLLFLISTAHRHILTLERFMILSARVLLIVNITAFVSFFINMYTKEMLLDDGFIGIYGKSGLMMHTLSLINFTYSVYYFFSKRYTFSIFFFISGFMCFYSLGLLIFIASISFVFMFNLNYNNLKKSLFVIPILVGLYFIVQAINPTTISYIEDNIERTISGVSNYSYDEEMYLSEKCYYTETPRKITTFVGGFKRLSDTKIAILGTGPGTYNSRTSFLLNGDYSSELSNIRNRPKYASYDIYPLWNYDITYRLNDGTRNQPFSSILALLVEYGVIQFIIFFVLIINLISNFKQKGENIKFLLFLFPFVLLNLVTENYIEYPEFFILILVILKIIETDITSKKTESI